MIDPIDGLPRADDIDTDRVRLQPMRPDDASALFPIIDDERLHAFTGGVPDTMDKLRSRLDVWAHERSSEGRQAWLNWVVRAADDGRVLGTGRPPLSEATTDRARWWRGWSARSISSAGSAPRLHGP